MFPPLVAPDLSLMHWKWAMEHRKTELQKSSGGDLRSGKAYLLSSRRTWKPSPLFFFYLFCCAQTILWQQNQPVETGACSRQNFGRKTFLSVWQRYQDIGLIPIAFFSLPVFLPLDHGQGPSYESAQHTRVIKALTFWLEDWRRRSIGNQKVFGILPRGRNSGKWHYTVVYELLGQAHVFGLDRSKHIVNPKQSWPYSILISYNLGKAWSWNFPLDFSLRRLSWANK